MLSLDSDTHTFAGETLTVLNEFSDPVADAINSIKRKQALVTASVTELEIRLTDAAVTIGDSSAGCRIDVDEVVAASDGGFRLFGAIEGAPPEGIQSFETASPVIDGIEPFSEGDRSPPGECLVTDRCFMWICCARRGPPVGADRGRRGRYAPPTSARAVREFVEMMTTIYPAAESSGVGAGNNPSVGSEASGANWRTNSRTDSSKS